MVRDVSFGACLKRLRLSNKMTLRKAAEESGLDVGYWSRVERNLLAPPASLEQLNKLIRIFNFSLMEQEFLISAAFNFHVGKLQERFS